MTNTGGGDSLVDRLLLLNIRKWAPLQSGAVDKIDFKKRRQNFRHILQKCSSMHTASLAHFVLSDKNFVLVFTKSLFVNGSKVIFP